MNRTRTSRVRAAGLAAVVALAIGACSDDDSEESTDSTATTALDPQTGPSESLSGAEIVIGQLVSETGVGVSTFADAVHATEAWEDFVNANGGIGGHPVSVETMDDQSDGAAGLAAAQSLVEDQDVIALVGAFNPIAVASALPYLAEQGVAMVNAFPVLPQDYESPVAFPIGQSTVDDVVSSLEVLKANGHDDVALVACAETPACSALGQVMEAEGPGIDVDYGGTVTVSSSATDYIAECLSLQDEGVGAVWMATAASVTDAFQADCSTQGYEPTYFFGYNAFTPELVDLPGITALGANYTVPFFADLPALESFTTALESAGQADAEGVVALDTWVALELFRTAMENLLPTLDRDPTREDAFAALYTIQDEDLGGLLPGPVSYSEADHHPSMTCQFSVGIADGEFTLPNDDSPVCTAGE
jgi:branched-chain amino acid transport system substrate-binding protein